MSILTASYCLHMTFENVFFSYYLSYLEETGEDTDGNLNFDQNSDIARGAIRYLYVFASYIYKYRIRENIHTIETFLVLY